MEKSLVLITKTIDTSNYPKISNTFFSPKIGQKFTKTDLVDSCKDGIGDLLLCVDWDLEYQNGRSKLKPATFCHEAQNQ